MRGVVDDGVVDGGVVMVNEGSGDGGGTALVGSLMI